MVTGALFGVLYGPAQSLGFEAVVVSSCIGIVFIWRGQPSGTDAVSSKPVVAGVDDGSDSGLARVLAGETVPSGRLSMSGLPGPGFGVHGTGG